MKSHQNRVKKKLPDSYCVRLNDRTGYIVWPGKIQGRGFEQPAIGLSTTARGAWESAWKTIKNDKQ